MIYYKRYVQNHQTGMLKSFQHELTEVNKKLTQYLFNKKFI